jgi:hypothetical protein
MVQVIYDVLFTDTSLKKDYEKEKRLKINFFFLIVKIWQVLYFCFDFLQYITSQEYSLTGPLEESPDYNDTHHIEHIEINSSQQQQHEDEVEDRYMNWIPCRGEGI